MQHEPGDAVSRKPIDATKRARDADREAAMQMLDAALADGQISGLEHRDRVSQVMRAQTLDELVPPLRDLQLDDDPEEPAVDEVADDESDVDEPELDTSYAGRPIPVKAIVGVLVAVGIGISVIAMLASSGSGPSPSPAPAPLVPGPFPGVGFPGFAQSEMIICDGEGKNCHDQNGKPRPDRPRARTPIPGVRLVGNPMASSNIRKAYESAVQALQPKAIEAIEVVGTSGGQANALIVPRDGTRTQRWTFVEGTWTSTTEYDHDPRSAFAPDAFNLDQVTAMIAEAPGVARTQREPTRVTFEPGRVTVAYRAEGDRETQLILAPDGTITP